MLSTKQPSTLKCSSNHCNLFTELLQARSRKCRDETNQTACPRKAWPRQAGKRTTIHQLLQSRCAPGTWKPTRHRLLGGSGEREARRDLTSKPLDWACLLCLDHEEVLQARREGRRKGPPPAKAQRCAEVQRAAAPDLHTREGTRRGGKRRSRRTRNTRLRGLDCNFWISNSG